MAKAAMRQAPAATEVIVNSSVEVKYQTDARGRNIGVVKPSALNRYRLLKMLGAENSKNEVLLGNAMLAYLVREIDGVRVTPPNTERELELRIAQLDDDGLGAVGTCLVEQFGLGNKDGEDRDFETEIKN